MTDSESTFTLADIEHLPGNLTCREIYMHLKHKDDDPAVSSVAAVSISAYTLGSLSMRVPTTETVNALVEMLAAARGEIEELREYISSTLDEIPRA